MQDIRKKKSSAFGGLTGDWRQILPIVRHRSRPDIVDATLKSSYLWQIVTILQLTQNMRAKLRKKEAGERGREGGRGEMERRRQGREGEKEAWERGKEGDKEKR